MNREILFRGKIKNIDELIGKGFLTDGAVNSISKWVYGVPIPRYPDLFLAWSEGNGEYEEITIIPKSITQHTGLTDKNNVRIFEGDILKTSFIKDVLKAVVKFGYYSQPDKILRTHLGFYFDFIDPIWNAIFKSIRCSKSKILFLSFTV